MDSQRSSRDFSRSLRGSQTDTERRVWSRLRDRRPAGAKFRRQHPIGPFIADFCCPEQRLIVELDGGQHAIQRDADAKRTAYLVAEGYRVICSPLPSPQGGEGEGKDTVRG